MINHNNDKIREWYQEGEVIHKVMGGGYLIYQRLTNSNIDPGTSYRWITLSGANDYICDGTTKYTKQQKQVSHDYQATWENVVPAVYRKGTVIEYQSPDCGYVPVVIQYRWVNLDPSTDFYCSGTTKMYKQQKQESTDSGQTWSNVVPAEFRMGGSAQTQCEECGYIPPIEPQYRTTSGTPYCSGVDKYVDVYSQVSYDGGSTWTTTATTATLVERNCEECGYVEPIYRWVEISGDYECSGTTKMSKEKKQQSTDSGATWSDVVPLETRMGSRVIEPYSTDCGWTPSGNKLKAYTNDNEYTVECDSSHTLTYTDCYETIGSDMRRVTAITIGDCSETLGQMSLKWVPISAITIPGTVKTIYTSALANNNNITSLTLEEGIKTIGQAAFEECRNLEEIVVPNSVTSVHTEAFAMGSTTDAHPEQRPKLARIVIGSGVTTIRCGNSPFFGDGANSWSQLTAPTESITFLSETPPTITNAQNGYQVFGTNSTHPKIYVPRESYGAYRSAQYWRDVANKIYPL